MAKQEGPRGFEMQEGSSAADATASTFTFASFVLSLSTSALMHLGVAPRGEAGEPEEGGEVNLPLAHQVIDILEMLQERTKGNLDEEESRLLAQVLHDLHLRFVEARGKS